MPIYEFYCSDCNTIFNFFCRRIVTDKKPACPKCGREDLDKLISRVSVMKRSSGGEGDAPAEGGEGGGEGMPDLPIDEARLERAMGMMESEMAGVDENDPRAAARFMRKFADAAGVEFGGGMQEAIRRMESGEDPDQIEAEMGDVMNDESQLFEAKKKAASARRAAPKVDTELYEF